MRLQFICSASQQSSDWDPKSAIRYPRSPMLMLPCPVPPVARRPRPSLTTRDFYSTVPLPSTGWRPEVLFHRGIGFCPRGYAELANCVCGGTLSAVGSGDVQRWRLGSSVKRRLGFFTGGYLFGATGSGYA
jgi:hypothetical protein